MLTCAIFEELPRDRKLELIHERITLVEGDVDFDFIKVVYSNFSENDLYEEYDRLSKWVAHDPTPLDKYPHYLMHKYGDEMILEKQAKIRDLHEDIKLIRKSYYPWRE